MSRANELAVEFMTMWQHRMKQVDIPILEGWFNLMLPDTTPQVRKRFKVLKANRIETLQDLLNECVGYKFVSQIDHDTDFCVLMERDDGRNDKEAETLLNSDLYTAGSRPIQPAEASSV